MVIYVSTSTIQLILPSYYFFILYYYMQRRQSQQKRLAEMRARSQISRKNNTNTGSSSNNEMNQTRMRIKTRGTSSLHNIFRQSTPKELILYDGSNTWTFRKMNSSQDNVTDYKYFNKNGKPRNISFSYIKSNTPYIYLNSMYVNEPKQPGNIPAAAVRNVLKRLAPSVYLENASTYVLNKNRHLPRYILPPQYNLYSGAIPNYKNIGDIADLRSKVAKDLEKGMTLDNIYYKYKNDFGLNRRIYRTFGKALPPYEMGMVAPI